MARQNRALRIAQDSAHQAMFDAEGRATPRVQRALLRAVEVQRPLVLANLRRLRRQRPHETPAQLSARLERDYLTAVTGAGAAVGGSAAIPGIGTVASLGLSAAATVGFLEATAFYAASVAELHGVHLEDPDRARTTVMAIMLGEEGTALLSAFSGQALGRGGGPKGAWGAVLNRSLPASAVKAVQGRILKRFLEWMLKKQCTALIRRAVPFVIGAVVGGAGNLMMGRAVIRATREAFGPAPDVVPGELGENGGPAAPDALPGARTLGETPEQQVEREIEERRARLREQASSSRPESQSPAQ